MSEFHELTRMILEFRDARNWKVFHKPKDVALSLMLEAAEVAEHFQWKSDEEIAAQLEAARGAVGEELADVLYWVLLLSHDLGIDLKRAFLDKMEKNQRKYPVEKARDRHTKYDRL